MMSIITNLHFIRPLWLLMLIPVIALVILLLKRQHTTSNWRNICDKHLLPHLLITQSALLYRWPYWALLFAWIVGIIALAGPAWSKHQQTVYQSNAAYMIALDISNHMDGTDIKPSRLAQAKFKIRQLLQANPTSNAGMIVFTSEPFTVSPLTHDSNTIDLLIPTLETNIMPIQGSDISAALDYARELLRQGGALLGNIVLITASPVNTVDIDAARRIATSGYTLSVLGMGTEQGTPIENPRGGYILDEAGNIIMSRLDTQGLQQLASAGGGRYQPYQADNSDINTLLSVQQPSKGKNTAEQTISHWHDRGQWFILALLPIALISFRRGWLERLL